MNFHYAFFLGRQPLLSGCEAWSVLAPFKPALIHVDERLLLVEVPRELPGGIFSHIGGSDRVGRVIGQLPSLPTSAELLDALSSTRPIFLDPPSAAISQDSAANPESLGDVPPGMSSHDSEFSHEPGKFRDEKGQERLAPASKVAFGLSTFSDLGFKRDFLIALKKEARQRGFKLRFIEPGTKNDRQLSSAQVLFNGLYREPNAEVTVVKLKDTFLALRTIWVQDIQAYERRDTGRPVRDAKVGMLPPKLAQQMINLAISRIPSPSPNLYDPFCGLGTILQEGVLRGFSMVGSDSNPAMVAASKQNVAALSSQANATIFQHDAGTFFPSSLNGKVEGIVTEPYLGKPLSAPLSAREVDAYVSELLPLYRAFFKNAAALLFPGAPLLFALPRLRTSQGWASFPSSFIDEVAAFGYDLQHLVPDVLEPFFPSFDPTVLEYNRPDALVGRDLRLWTRL